MSDPLAEMEAQARARFVRWHAGLWREVVDGPAQRLAAALEAGAQPEAQRQALVGSYLRLACEGIGLGYLFPSSPDGDNFFGLAWRTLLPEGLARLPAPRQAQALADCWNLAENLEKEAVWLRRIFTRVCGGGVDLGGLERLVQDVARRALEPPARALGPALSVRWIHLGEEDRRFLPGSLHFLSPTVVCVHDRLRMAVAGEEAVTLGVWLTDPPLVLGPMGCREGPKPPGEAALAAGLDLLEKTTRLDARAADGHEVARNEWRAALTLATSQYVVGLLPA